MSTRWHIGAKELHGAITAYAKRFNLLEVRVTIGGPASSDENAPSPARRGDANLLVHDVPQLAAVPPTGPTTASKRERKSVLVFFNRS